LMFANTSLALYSNNTSHSDVLRQKKLKMSRNP
jgi:hypothetical protein